MSVAVAEATETVAYKFDGELYANNEQGRQDLLEAVDTALTTEAWNDSELETEAEREDAVSMSYDGTHYAADFWDNCMAIMQHAPYTLDITRHTADELTADELEWL